jgi:hypothetical protein
MDGLDLVDEPVYLGRVLVGPMATHSRLVTRRVEGAVELAPGVAPQNTLVTGGQPARPVQCGPAPTARCRPTIAA